MAWEDRTPFEAIERQFGYSEQAVIRLMRQQLKRRSFNSWRARVTGRVTKHQAKRPASVLRAHCPSHIKLKIVSCFIDSIGLLIREKKPSSQSH